VLNQLVATSENIIFIILMKYFKEDAPKEIINTLSQIEARADECFKSLKLLKLPHNQATWAVLTDAILRIEAEIAQHGDNSARFDSLLVNLSRLSTVSIGWMIEHGRPPSRLVTKWRWNANINAAAGEAVNVANNYDAFLTCFPMWYKNRYLAEILTPSSARFISLGGVRERQVSAYQKKFKPNKGKFASPRPTKPDQSPELQRLFDEVLETCRKDGRLRFQCADHTQLWRALLPEYQSRVNAICRRADSLDLGEYTLEEFKKFYAGLLAMCAAHEHLCFRWMVQGKEFPLDSAVMVKQKSQWAHSLSRLTKIATNTCHHMIKDLTLGTTRSLDLHVHPFVPLNAAGQELALAPQFPLHSNIDENILKIPSLLRPAVYDATTIEKEVEMRATLMGASRFRVEGPATLPKPLPDIDLIVEDLKSSSVLIAETKWVRKPLRPIESVERDADVLKGVKQLEHIREFLRKTPDHIRLQGKLSKSLNCYDHIHYLLVARDHWLWIEPTDEIAIVEFDPFLRMLTNSEDLNVGVNDLLTYDWLPVEGRDFFVKYERAFANGVAIESEVFHPITIVST
jgi:hypothetical protein